MWPRHGPVSRLISCTSLIFSISSNDQVPESIARDIGCDRQCPLRQDRPPWPGQNVDAEVQRSKTPELNARQERRRPGDARQTGMASTADPVVPVIAGDVRDP